MKTGIMSVIIGALGLIKQGTEKFINPIADNNNILDAQKIALLNITNIRIALRKFKLF